MKETDKTPCLCGTYTLQTISKLNKMFISAKEKNKAGSKEGTWGLECRVWIAVLDRVAKEMLSTALKMSKPRNVGGAIRTWDSEVRGL